ncbi:uncharacterized protein A1O9_12596, partial [Exophiala aquamarina CBS 119918]
SDSSGAETTVYDVERILAQDDFHGKMLYLVKWQGYGEEQCTWEPPQNFSDPQTLREWETRLDIGDALDDEGVAALQERMNAYQDAQQAQEEDQRQLRVSKRRRVVKAPKSREFSSSESDTPMISKRSKIDASSAAHPTSTRSINSRTTSISQANTAAVPRSANSAAVSSFTEQNVPTQGEKGKETATSPEIRKRSSVTLVWGVKGKPENHKPMSGHPSENRGGEKFKNLRHQNNYEKAASRKGVPDMSRMELKSSEEWAKQRTVAAPLSPLAQSTGDSWLFIPEDGRARVASPIPTVKSPSGPVLRPEIDDSAVPQGSQQIHARTSQSESSVSTNAEHQTMKKLITTKRGRPFNKGAELLVYLSLGGHSVGDVKFLHLPLWLRTKFMAIKSAGDALLKIDFPQHDVKNWAEYLVFAKEFMVGAPCALGEIEAYEDTKLPADSLAEYLERESACAIWFYPDPLETVVMILYSQAAPRWNLLGNTLTTPAHKHRLRLLIRNTRSPLYSTQPPQDQGVLQRASGIFANTATRRTAWTEEGASEAGLASGRRRPSRDANDTLVHNLETDQACNRVDVAKLDLTEKAGTGDMMYEKHSLSRGAFQYLTTVSSRIKADPSNVRIFIAFANLFPYEAQVLREWLGEFVEARNIFSNTEKNGWEEFLESWEKKVGVVLFHQDLPNFTSLKMLSLRLQGDTLVCFNVSTDTSGRFSFRRIFPRGTAVCITEPCLTGFLEQTLDILRWFEFTTKQKKSNWKLVLFPDAVNKCLQRLCSLNTGAQKILGEIIGILLRLTKPLVRSPMDPDQYISGENFDGEGGTNDSLVLSPREALFPSTHGGSGTFSTNERALKARDQKFSEYIRAWTVLNCMNYRRFFVIDGHMTSETEAHARHIQFGHPETFIQENQ